MDHLFAHSLLVVTGKGGVGKSTVAAALGLAADRRGLRTIVVEVAARDDLSRALGASDAAGGYAERAVADGLHHISIDPQRAMEEYLRQQLPIGALAALLARSRIFTTLSAATPGMRELLTVGKVWELAQHQPAHARLAALRPGGARRSGDRARLGDAAGAGHVRVGRACRPGRQAGPRGGELPRQTRDTRRWWRCRPPRRCRSPRRSSLRARLREQLGLDLSLVVVNAVVPHRFSGADERTLRAAPPSPARHAALFAATWARHQRRQISRLRRGLHDVPLVTLPLVFESALDAAALERLSRELER